MPPKGSKQTDLARQRMSLSRRNSPKVKELMKRLSVLNRKPNKISIDESGKYITIYLNSGKATTINTEDYDKIKDFTWDTYKHRNTWYVVSNTSGIGGLKRKKIFLHRLILGLKLGELTDHINGDGLDNRRINLRVATNQQNCFNRSKLNGVDGKRCVSRHKGVRWSVNNKKWLAYIQINGKNIYLGSFDSEAEAALAYDIKAYDLFRSFARVNFPERLDTWFG